MDDHVVNFKDVLDWTQDRDLCWMIMSHTYWDLSCDPWLFASIVHAVGAPTTLPCDHRESQKEEYSGQGSLSAVTREKELLVGLLMGQPARILLHDALSP